MMHTIPTSLQGLRVNEIGKGAFTRTDVLIHPPPINTLLLHLT